MAAETDALEARGVALGADVYPKMADVDALAADPWTKVVDMKEAGAEAGAGSGTQQRGDDHHGDEEQQSVH